MCVHHSASPPPVELALKGRRRSAPEIIQPPQLLARRDRAARHVLAIAKLRIGGRVYLHGRRRALWHALAGVNVPGERHWERDNENASALMIRRLKGSAARFALPGEAVRDAHALGPHSGTSNTPGVSVMKKSAHRSTTASGMPAERISSAESGMLQPAHRSRM